MEFSTSLHPLFVAHIICSAVHCAYAILFHFLFIFSCKNREILYNFQEKIVLDLDSCLFTDNRIVSIAST